MASATPDLRLPSQPQGITAPWLVPNYTAWWQGQMCVNNLPKVITWKRKAGSRNPRPFQSQVQNSTHYTTRPHSRIHASRKQLWCIYGGMHHLNSWPTFSPYLYNGVWSELTCRNSLSHSRLACSRLSAHIQPSVNNPDTNGAGIL